MYEISLPHPNKAPSKYFSRERIMTALRFREVLLEVVFSYMLQLVLLLLDGSHCRGRRYPLGHALVVPEVLVVVHGAAAGVVFIVAVVVIVMHTAVLLLVLVVVEDDHSDLALEFFHDFEAFEVGIALNHVNFELDAAVPEVFYGLRANILDRLDDLSEALFGVVLVAALEFLGEFQFFFKGDVPLNITLKVILVIIIVIVAVGALVARAVCSAAVAALALVFVEEVGGAVAFGAVLGGTAAGGVVHCVEGEALLAILFPAACLTDISIEDGLVSHLLHLVQLLEVFDARHFEIYLLFDQVELVVLVVSLELVLVLKQRF